MIAWVFISCKEIRIKIGTEHSGKFGLRDIWSTNSTVRSHYVIRYPIFVKCGKGICKLLEKVVQGYLCRLSYNSQFLNLIFI